MKRSEIEAAIEQARGLLGEFRWTLPAWADWGPSDYAAAPELATHLHRHQMGWDVTDFGSDDFHGQGLTLFCLRNGIQSDQTTRPYAEKLLFIGEGQETPYHCHRVKLEDIINRGGGVLMIEFRRPPGATKRTVTVIVDGRDRELEVEEPLRLFPGQSVSIPRGIYHRFYAEPGGGFVLGGEVSQVNDDTTDNYFWEPLRRFSSIEEDVTTRYPLWNEVGQPA